MPSVAKSARRHPTHNPAPPAVIRWPAECIALRHMRHKRHPKLRINREAIAVLTDTKLERVAGGADRADGRVHCCSKWTETGQSTTSSSILM
jgi:hypothetical protein